MLASSILFLNEFNVVLNLYTIQQQQKQSDYFSVVKFLTDQIIFYYKGITENYCTLFIAFTGHLH